MSAARQGTGLDLNAQTDARVVCTVGMHRSGTSLVARLVNLLGVHLGPDPRVLTSGDDNPKGYWEYRPFVDVNDEILARFGGEWDQLPSFPPSWAGDPRLDDLKARVRQLVATDFSAAPLWGWKDPRACLTLPFWQDVIGPMRYVICVRNPGAVVASLLRRERGSRENPERLWLAHMQALLADTSGHPRLFVSYEDLIEDWLPELRRLAAFIGHPERAEDPRVHAAVADFLEQELCHHHISMEDLARDERLSFQTVALAFALRGYARPLETPFNDAIDSDRAGPRVHQALDVFADRALAAWNQTTALAAERDRVAAERDRVARVHHARVAEYEALAGESRAQVEALAREHRAQVEALAREHRMQAAAERDAFALRDQQSRNSIASLESALRTVTLERDVRAGVHQAAMRTLDEIQSSFAWKLVTVLRGILVTLLPAGTRRRRAFHAGLSWIRKRLIDHRRRRMADLPVT